MGHIIAEVPEDSLGFELGLLPGDSLETLNGEKVVDVVDYQHLISCTELTVGFKRGDEEMEVSCEKEDWEELGVEFRDQLLVTRMCLNHCVFCFVDQMPKGCRESLYDKDDDWRMSLMMGNFVTLTNVTDKELSRIIRRQASPLYISVHATDPDLREKLMGVPQARKLMQQLTRLKDAGLHMHLQVVLCPGLNDGEALEKTIADCASLAPTALSLAIVPVGLTGYREGLCPLHPFTPAQADDVLRQIKRWQKHCYKTIGSRFVFAADEFYILAGQPIPKEESYEDFPQIENGIGLMRQTIDDYLYAISPDGEATPPAKPHQYALACGVSAAQSLTELLTEHPIENVNVTVFAVENTFFAGAVTVTGLLTGSCLKEGLPKDLKAQGYEALILSDVMLRANTHTFLDDTTVEQLAKALDMDILITPNDGESLAMALAGKGGEKIHG